VARVDRPEFWEGLYASGGDGWDLGGPTLPLVDFVNVNPPPRGRVVVPGAGRGHDARFLASRGYDVTAIDFSPAAVAAARALVKRDRVNVEVLQRDLFSLPQDYTHAFDGAWEYTCYCAIAPARRAAYVDVLRAIIRPGGWLLGCFFPLRALTPGPPFRVSTAEIRRVLRAGFRIERAFPPLRSVRPRQGREWMVLARRT
jgi:SAM-dependent methyltransferase